MKKIVFYIIKKSQDDPDLIFCKENKNSLLKIINKEYFFKSLYNSDEEKILVNYSDINFDETLFKNLITIFKDQIEIAKQISEEEVEKYPSTETSVESIIHSKIYKGQYGKYESIFHFISDLFCSILMNHTFINGNKRVSLVFLIGSLRFFGYHFKWSKGLKKDYSNYENYLKELVVMFEKNKANDFEKLVLEQSKWIKRNSVIALEWR